MAEEVKQQEGVCCAGKKGIAALLKVLLGLVFLVLGAWAIYALRKDLLTVIKGCIGPFLLLAGLITLAIAKE
jgi:hypothetical protein